MAVEMHVFFRGKLPNKRELSRAMGDLGFPLSITAGSLEKQRGFMPMKLRREDIGVEFDVFEGRATVEEIGGKKVDPRFERSANFRWGGDEDEMLAGICAAAALAKLVSGVVFDAEAGELLSVDEAIALAREALHTTLKPEDTRRRGNRPADIKRYLTPLLKQRDDLVLIGPLLVIRPVRHILRGAMIKPWRKTHVEVRSCLNLLCHPFGVNGYDGGVARGGGPVWEPYFEPLLMDCLAEEIFEPIGKIVSLEDFAAALPDQDWLPLFRITSLLLSGARDQAMAYVQRVESANCGITGRKPWAAQRDRLHWDVAKLCETFHSNEAGFVKALKLESIWEPSPFPIEVSKSERKQRSYEPTTFTPRPWIARPKWLLGELPEKEGDVRFAKRWLRRNGQIVLVLPLSRREAEERHRNVEGYVLAVRLQDGLLVLLEWNGLDRNDPERPKYLMSRYPRFPELQLHGTQTWINASINRHEDLDAMLQVVILDVYVRATWRLVWQWSFLPRRNEEEMIKDYREGKEINYHKMTDAEARQLTCPTPEFGEYDALVALVQSVLLRKGYGEVV